MARTKIARLATLGAAAAALLLFTAGAGGASKYEPPMTKCEMLYNLKGWSFAIKLQQGEGSIVCDNGQKADVDLAATAIGFSIGKGEIIGGKATFTPVADLEELLGQYVSASAHAGATRSGEASVLTKGEVSMALAGSGNGVDIGATIGGFTIKRK